MKTNSNNPKRKPEAVTEAKPNAGHFVIESGIPAPHRGLRIEWPLREMKVGESFFVPTEIVSEVRVRTVCSTFGARNREYRFTVHKEHGGCRVWRIEAKTKMAMMTYNE